MKRSNRRSRTPKKRQQGSALLVSLMIMVGLSMLGLGFVAISETESAISVNETYGIQTQAAAEAGAKLAMEWFQDPAWSLGDTAATVTRNGEPIMPPNTNAVKTQRVLGITPTYTGYYKASGGTILFDKPYKPQHENRFYGIEANADVIVDTTTAPTIIDNINTFLFGQATASPRITSIRVYAPPISGGTLYTAPSGRRFWQGGTRYGVATIAATASRFVDGQATSSKVVRIIVGEFPVPVPGGPLQSAVGAIDYGGSSNIHWGMEQSAGDLNDTKTGSTLPWANPYEMVHIERGYDDNVWPVQVGSTFDGFDYLSEVIGRTYTDPWFGLRAVGNVQNTLASYQRTAVEDVGDPRYANFEGQDSSSYPDKKKIIFPKIDFNFWKRVAIQGRGTKGIYYFKYVPTGADAEKFRRNGIGTAQTVAHWVNAVAGAALGGGFYFFDTADGSNPQNDPTPALTAELAWSSGDVANPFLMKGFIYLNAEDFRHTGMGGSAPTLKYKMPGEPFRDIGYRKIDMATGEWETDPSTGAFVHEGEADNDFSYQDLNGNGRFDMIVQGPLPRTYNDGAGDVVRAGQYVPKVWHANSEDDPSPGPANADCEMLPDEWDGDPAPGTNYCSEPHEPYFNMIYPTTRTGAVSVGWEAGDAQTQRPKADGVTCGNTVVDPTEIPDKCTSNAYDEYGAAVDIPASIDGLVYNEGTYDTQGNMDVYGAMLAGGEITGNGNLDFWFKEELKRGDYLPPGAPRVIIYSMQTDDID